MFTTNKAKENLRTAICSAIMSRRIIDFYYHGSFRSVEPFCLGVTRPGKAENESLWCYQVGGDSEFGDAVGWKLYRTSEISDLGITDMRFSSDRPGYDPDNLEMTTIYYCASLDKDDESQPQELIEVPAEIEREKPSYEELEKAAVIYSAHNEVMRRFRFAHPTTLTELETTVYD
jgi:hypothetical protein